MQVKLTTYVFRSTFQTDWLAVLTDWLAILTCYFSGVLFIVRVNVVSCRVTL